MFEAKLEHASLLRKIIDSMKELVVSANFDVSPTAFALQAMDISHIGMVALYLHPDSFVEYECDKTISMGLNLQNLSKILRCTGNDDSVTITVADDANRATFKFENPNNKKISEFNLKMIELDSEHLSVPNHEYTSVIKLPSAEFQKICRDLISLGEYVKISVTNDEVKFSTQGDMGSARVALEPKDADGRPEDEISIETAHPDSVSFTLRYLYSFGKANLLNPQVKLSLCKTLPLIIEYQIGETGYIRFFVAPKVDD
jgi:proliferating cell nuclear antigen